MFWFHNGWDGETKWMTPTGHGWDGDDSNWPRARDADSAASRSIVSGALLAWKSMRLLFPESRLYLVETLFHWRSFLLFLGSR